MRDTGETLFNKFKGNVMKYKDLSTNAKKAIDIYYIDEFGYEILPDDTFGYVEIPMKELQDAIACPDDLSLVNFEEYHKWFMRGGDIPNHSEVWAVILSNDDEIIIDRWHRFHCYCEKDIEVVPCVIPISKIFNIDGLA